MQPGKTPLPKEVAVAILLYNLWLLLARRLRE
jgi:hypothetical protein